VLNVMYLKIVKSLYTWIATYNSMHFSSFSDVLDFFSSFSLIRVIIRVFLCILSL
jgi:hypothetical protein